MKIIRKYTAIQVGSTRVNNSVKPIFHYGEIRGPHYDETIPKEHFNTEGEAIEWAYEEDKDVYWMIVPVLSFE